MDHWPDPLTKEAQALEDKGLSDPEDKLLRLLQLLQGLSGSSGLTA